MDDALLGCCLAGCFGCLVSEQSKWKRLKEEQK